MRYPNGSTTRPTISGFFGPRTAPVAGASTFHKGADCVGFDQIRSVAAGRVVYVGVHPRWTALGRAVFVQHDGYFVKYGHMASTQVHVGQQIQEADFLGSMDTTGVASGKHLHFEITLGTLHYDNTGQIDPLAFIASRLTAAGPAATPGTTALQTSLKLLGYEITIDGIYGPQTEGVVRDFQSKNGLEVDGIAGPLTLAAIDAKLNAPVGGNKTTRPTAEIQALVGATVDGIWGPQTTEKVKAWQTANGLEADGWWGPLSDAKGFPTPVGTPIIKVDGVWGESTTSAVQIKLGITPVDGIRGPVTTKSLQLAIGMPQDQADGVWGPNTARWLQTFLIGKGYNLDPWGADGDFGELSVTRFQEFLNSGQPFTHTTPPVTPPVTEPQPPVEPVTSDNPRGLLPTTPVYPGAAFGLLAPLGGGLRTLKGTTTVVANIDIFALHRTGNDGDELDWFSYKNSRGSCPNWYIRKNGQVIELIRPMYKPALTGPEWNYRTWGVELQGAGDGTPQQFEAVAQLMAWNYSETVKNGAIDTIASTYALERWNQKGHQEMVPTECPGPWWMANIPTLITRAEVIYAEKYAPGPEPSDEVIVSRKALEQLKANQLADASTLELMLK